MDLANLREQIDQIDTKIVELYKERMEVCKKVGLEKAKNNNSVLDPNRESQIIYRLSSLVDNDLKLYVKELYEVMFSTSRAYQSKYIKKESETVKQIEQLLQNGVLDFPVSATVACQGIEGANSMTATNKLFPINNITYFKNFEGVFSAVEKGFCDFGVLPIENSTAGSVLEVYDLMKKYNFNIVRSVRIKIDHCLAVIKGTKLSEVKSVLSHNQALKQCSNIIKELKLNEVVAENTAVAARSLVESNDKTVAVICSEDCANAYGLEILKKNIQNSASNYTRFICIKKDLTLYSDSQKISFMTSLSHTPGSLSRLLSRFYSLGLNLTKIESRPIENSDFDFMFYFDFEGSVEDSTVRNLIAELQKSSEHFVLLGSYKEII